MFLIVLLSETCFNIRYNYTCYHRANFTKLRDVDSYESCAQACSLYSVYLCRGFSYRQRDVLHDICRLYKVNSLEIPTDHCNRSSHDHPYFYTDMCSITNTSKLSTVIHCTICIYLCSFLQVK